LERKIKNNCLITKESRGIVSQYNVPLCRMMHRVGQIAKRVSEPHILHIPKRAYKASLPKDPEDPFSAKHPAVTNDAGTKIHCYLSSKGPDHGFPDSFYIAGFGYSNNTGPQYGIPQNPAKSVNPADYTPHAKATKFVQSPKVKSLLDAQFNNKNEN